MKWLRAVVLWVWSWVRLHFYPVTLTLETETRPVMPLVKSRRRPQHRSRRTLRRTTGGWGGAVAL